jgi:hypothetical protein
MRRSATMTAAIGLGLGLALGTTGWAAAHPTVMIPEVGEGQCSTGGGTPTQFRDLLAPAGALYCKGGTYDNSLIYDKSR